MLAALRSPTYLPAFLFEDRIAVWLAALAVAAVLFFVARSQNSRPLLRLALALAVFTALWSAAALCFDTPGERLHKAHLALSAATTHADPDGILSFLAPDFSCPSLKIQFDPASAQETKSQLADILKDAGIKQIHITAYRSTLSSDNSALTTLTILAETGNGPVKTSWQLYWKDLPGSDWKIASATLTHFNDAPVPPDQVIPLK